MNSRTVLKIIAILTLSGCAGGFVDKNGNAWVDYESARTRVTNYYNPKSISRNGNLVRVETMENDMREYQTPSSEKTVYEFKCMNGKGPNQVRVITREYFSKINLMGNSNKEGASGWGDANLGTYYLSNILCKL